MDYVKIYRSLIKSRKCLNRKRGDGNYYENHHIIPKCFGGTNSSKNLVLLTFKEHFLAHLLLTKCFSSDTKRHKMMYALIRMCTRTNKQQGRISAREHEKIMKCLVELNTERCKGKPLSKEHRLNISIGEKGKFVSQETKDKQRQAKIGVPRSEEAKKNMRVPKPKSKDVKKSKKHGKNISKTKKEYYLTHEHACKKKIGDRGDTSGWIDDYVNSDLSIYEIAKKYNIFYRQLIKEMILNNIPLRSETKTKKGKTTKGYKKLQDGSSRRMAA
jgi:hypothetical protein